MKSKLILFICTVLIISCNKKTDKIDKTENIENIENIKISEFKVDVKTEEISKNEFQSLITTNFPENTPFTITVSRDYRRKNNDEQYAGQFYYSYRSLVKNNQLKFNFKIDDKKWIKEYEDTVKEYEDMTKEYKETYESLTEIDRKTIKDTIEISILYTPLVEQSEEIKSLIGAKGENLTGKDVEVFSEYKIYNKIIKIYNEFKQ
jgi:hypothetical protein